MENFINNVLDISSSDNESDIEYGNESIMNLMIILWKIKIVF